MACFYILRIKHGAKAAVDYYHAVYLMRRTVQDLVNGVAAKLDIESSRIQRCIHLTKNGLNVVLDDDVVRELPEGQDMLVELTGIGSDSAPAPMKREWDSGANDAQLDGDTEPSMDLGSSPLELKLIY